MKETTYIWAYLTSINLNSDSAESLQTCSMINAFKEVINIKFQLFTDRKYSPNICGVKSFSFGQVFKNRIARQCLVFLSFFLFKSRNAKYSVFTREFLLALFSHSTGANVILELHKVPGRNIFRVLSLVGNSKRFKILAISEGLKQSILKVNPELNVTSEHDGVDLGKWPKKDRYSPSVSASLKVIYTGSLHKGDDIFLLASAAKHFPILKFYIYGGSDNQIEDLLKHVDFRVLSNIEFKGRLQHEEIPGIQCDSDILFFPLTKSNALWESTSPLKIFEYMAAETPIVASNIGTITEVLNNANSYLFDPESDKSLIDAIENVLSDLRDGNFNRPRAARTDVENFTWSKRVERIVGR